MFKEKRGWCHPSPRPLSPSPSFPFPPSPSIFSSLLLLLFLLFFYILIFLEQILIDAHAFEVYAEVGMMVMKLPFAKIKALAKISRGCHFTSIMKIIRGLEILNDCLELLLQLGHLSFRLCCSSIIILFDLLQLLTRLLLSNSDLGQPTFQLTS